MRPFLRAGDFWSGLVLAGLGTYIVAVARGWDYHTEEGPGPGFFPVWYGSLMIVLSVLLVAGTVLKRHEPGKAVKWRDVGRAMTCWAAFVVTILVMKFAGFIVAFAALTWFMASVMASQKQKIAIPLAIGMSVFFYVLFAVALDVSLPTGVFG